MSGKYRKTSPGSYSFAKSSISKELQKAAIQYDNLLEIRSTILLHREITTHVYNMLISYLEEGIKLTRQNKRQQNQAIKLNEATLKRNHAGLVRIINMSTELNKNTMSLNMLKNKHTNMICARARKDAPLLAQLNRQYNLRNIKKAVIERIKRYFNVVLGSVLSSLTSNAYTISGMLSRVEAAKAMSRNRGKIGRHKSAVQTQFRQNLNKLRAAGKALNERLKRDVSKYRSDFAGMSMTQKYNVLKSDILTLARSDSQLSNLVPLVSDIFDYLFPSSFYFQMYDIQKNSIKRQMVKKTNVSNVGKLLRELLKIKPKGIKINKKVKKSLGIKFKISKALFKKGSSSCRLGTYKPKATVKRTGARPMTARTKKRITDALKRKAQRQAGMYSA